MANSEWITEIEVWVDGLSKSLEKQPYENIQSAIGMINWVLDEVKRELEIRNSRKDGREALLIVLKDLMEGKPASPEWVLVIDKAGAELLKLRCG